MPDLHKYCLVFLWWIFILSPSPPKEKETLPETWNLANDLVPGKSKSRLGFLYDL